MSYNKKALLSIVKKLDKAKAPGKPKDVKVLNQQGQRKYPGPVTEIQGDTMATDGYGYIPLMVVPNNGEGPQLVMPNTGEHKFNGATSFTEYPVNDQDFYEDDLDEEQIAELRAGGYIVEDISVPQLTQAQKGGKFTEQHYNYKDSKNKYKKIGDKWYISNDVTDFEFKPIKDPTGNRTKELNKNAIKIANRPTPTGIESNINKALNYSMDKAARAGKYFSEGNNDAIDNFRHPMAGRYTAEAIANKTGNIPYISNTLGFLGSTALGVGHEVSTLFGDTRSWPNKLKEAGEDIYNNTIGAKVGASSMTNKDKTNYLLYLSENNMLPDGIVSPNVPKKGFSNNLYFKKNSSDKGTYNTKYEEGGFLPQAQAGIIQGAPTPTGLIQERPKSIMNMSQADAKKVLAEEKKQKQIALQEKNQPRYQPTAPAVSESTRTGIPNEVVAAIQNAIYMESPEYKAEQKAKKAAQAQFEKEQWAKYNNMTLGEKAVDRTNAFLNQGFLMGANALAGEQAYIPGMAAGLDPSSSEYDNYLNATNQTRGLSLNDVVNVFNPGNWGGHAGRQYGEGNYATGAAELGLGLLGTRGVPLGTALAKSSANKLINSKNAKELVGLLKGIPRESSLPRLSAEEYSNYKTVIDIARKKAINNNIIEQYEYALKRNLPEEHLQRVFNKSREEIEREIPLIRPRVERQQALNAHPMYNEVINLVRPSRSPIRPIPLEEGNVANTLLNNTSTTEELTAMANSLGMSGDELARFRDVSQYSRDNIIRHSLEDNAARQHMRESDYWENLAINVDEMRPINDITNRTFLNTDQLRNAVTNYGTGKKLSLPKLNQDKLLNYISEHPYYKEKNVLQNVTNLSLRGSGSLKNVHNSVANRSTANIKSGDVFTGSLNTSHSSYIPQLKQVFKYKEGQPQFLGYKPMNPAGFLNDYAYTTDDIAKYLNTEIDEQIKRGIIPGNIQRPYSKKNKTILLPHYGIKQFEEGGFIDADLTDEEIKQYEKGGYVIEYLP